RGDYQLALQIGKLASNRGVAVDAIAFPMAALPDDFESAHSELALIYAIARQESAFDNEALSTAGALGLLQMLPATAREMAFNIGVPFSRDRLTDPEYNATLGGAYLRTLLDRYRGSLVLALAAFNAGLSRADRWIEIYGDPRNADVDAIDWIERIPFDETRNYVQRVLENLQVYRARLGDSPLRLGEDLDLAG
ncbi:MAG: lytic transglycosylase domain-containing protein, partial [Alphaproteobacteria bacterium]